MESIVSTVLVLFVTLCLCLRVLKRQTPALDMHNPYSEISGGCILSSANRLIFVLWVVFTLVEGGTSSNAHPLNLWLIDT